ncbi:hypothetical protein G6O69_05715 [Pseudenhygromyxa sp. WMMC2535]|uniref:hypothetical protein n=1 Tax=Pseudenhygromyxa sp. WMMC2535 TaxID=2712867 RepID=UPI0015583408|nr:hypothetical protein [Pseudenhygromyxa sp. WMMC2535]NVB37319.1 hypothetical protein [Pseudenhygromyxa sp. WMMC2535]
MSSPIKDISKRDTKAVIFSAYEELSSAYRALEKQYNAALKAKPKALPAAPDAGAGEGAAPQAAASPAGASLSAQLTAVGGRLGDYTSGLQRNLSAEAVTLSSIHERVETLTKRLTELYAVEVGEGALAKLIADYEATAEAAKQELSSKSEAADKALAAKREAWAKEKAAHEAELAGQAAELDKSRTREAETYAYDLDQARKRERDEREQAAKAFAAELAELRETKQAEWDAREQAVSEREAELAELEQTCEGLDEALAEARKRGEGEGMGVARRETKVAAELAKKDAAGKTRVYELRIASLEETLAKQAAQIGGLSQQLDTAISQAQDLAVKAIEGSSNSTSFEAIREIAMEQAKNSGKGK